MKKFPLFAILLVLSIQARNPVPPHAVAQLCGNTVIQAKNRKIWQKQIERQGCAEVRFVPLEDDYFLAYGVKVLVSE